MQFGILGSGSWATALAKILTDKGNKINWLLRSEEMISHMRNRHHNPNYLGSVYFDNALLNLSTSVEEVVNNSDNILVAIPSAYLEEVMMKLPPSSLAGKNIISSVKGMVPGSNILLNEFLVRQFNFNLKDYVTIMGPCHAEEVANEKLSYLTFSGLNPELVERVAENFSVSYINTVTNSDVIGVQYAAILKNIYALGAGIAHGLDYGDNFLSVLIANCADEMAGFLRKVGIPHIEVGVHETGGISMKKTPNYAASVYLGDLLVTCYSPFSRNRTFGNMIGKGYTVQSAQLEMNMVAEGYNASRSVYIINQEVGAEMPIAEAVYKILWEHYPVAAAFRQIEKELV